MGRSPEQVWQAHWRRHRTESRRVDEAALRNAMTRRDRRRVRADGTVSHDGQLYEVDQGFLASRVVTVATCLLDQPPVPWLEYESKVFALHRCDPVENGRRRRTAHPALPSDTQTAFDPASALLEQALGRSTRQMGDDR